MKRLATLLAFLCLGTYLQAQPLVKGRVTDKTSGQPITGASIIASQQKTTLSDANGRFTIAIGKGQTLVIDHVNYEPISLQVNDQDLNITLMPKVNQLSEVTVVGALGVKKKARELSTSSQQINSTELNQAKPVNPILGMASKVAGLRINMFDSKVDPDVQVNLRGIRSHSGDNAPLYVVDGVPVPAINRLNPNDIESVNVLKGANAAALYGSEGVNGVLIITTKKGSTNQQVRVSNTTLFESVSRLPEQQTTYGNGVNGVYNATEYRSWGPAYDGSVKLIGTVLPNGTQDEIIYAANKDARKDFFNTGITTQTDVSLSGGDANSTFFLSAQHVNTTGIIAGDKNTRTGARFNGSRNFGKLTARFNLNYVYNRNDVTPSEPWSTVYRHPAHINYKNARDWEKNAFANPNYWYSTNQPNPYFNIDNQRTLTNQQTINANIELNYPFTSWFSAIYRVGMYNRNEQSRNTTGKFTYSTAGRTHIAGSVTDAAEDFRRLNSDLILDFHKQFGKFSTKLLLGNNLRTDDTKANAVGASALVVPGIFNPGNSTGQLNGSSSISQYRQTAVYGEFTAGYNNYLFLTLTGRNEWVSVLSPDNRSYFYPSVGASFIFTDAIEGLKYNRTLSYGKLFTSYNRTGNVNGIAPYALNNVYSQNNGFPFGTLPGFSLGTNYPNFNMKPEFVNSFEIGTQLAFFRNRLNVDLTYAYSLATDGIIQTDLAGSSGYASALVNAFEVANNIFELGINGDVIRKKDLKWNLGFTMYHMNNKVKSIYGNLPSLHTFRQNYVVVGQPYNTFMFYDYKRDPNGNIIVNGNTGLPVSTTELYNAGTGTPPWQFGLHTSFDFKDFHIGAQFDYRLGAIMYSEAANRMIQDGTSPLTTAYGRQPFVIPGSVVETAPGVYDPNTKTVAGDRAYFTSYVAPVQSNYAVNANFFKLRELQVAYNIPARFLNGQRIIKQASVALIGRNLFSIWHKDNIYNDPEFVYAGGSSEGYLSWRHLPPTRMVGFSLNIGL